MSAKPGAGEPRGSNGGPLTSGQVLGKLYRVEAPIASGGYAIIYEATRLEDGASIVIKALRGNAVRLDPAAADRFVREAVIAARLNHPHVVRIFNFGRTRERVLYIAMERLYGSPLDDKLYREPTPQRDVQVLLAQLLEVLGALHDLGIVHRDLKPGNIFVLDPQTTPPGADAPYIKLLDMGFAKLLTRSQEQALRQEELSLARPLTRLGERVGTPGYMAPEVLTGGESSFRSDLYAVGIIGHELLTGRKAFEGKGMQRAMAQLNSAPARAPAAIRAAPLYRPIARLLAHDPGRRYATAAEAREAILAAAVEEDFSLTIDVVDPVDVVVPDDDELDLMDDDDVAMLNALHLDLLGDLNELETLEGDLFEPLEPLHEASLEFLQQIDGVFEQLEVTERSQVLGEIEVVERLEPLLDDDLEA